jgi:hypothetical protein
MWTTWPAAGSFFTIQNIGLEALKVLEPRLWLFENGDVANPLIAR